MKEPARRKRVKNANSRAPKRADLIITGVLWEAAGAFKNVVFSSGHGDVTHQINHRGQNKLRLNPLFLRHYGQKIATERLLLTVECVSTRVGNSQRHLHPSDEAPSGKCIISIQINCSLI